MQNRYITICPHIPIFSSRACPPLQRWTPQPTYSPQRFRCTHRDVPPSQSWCLRALSTRTRSHPREPELSETTSNFEDNSHDKSSIYGSKTIPQPLPTKLKLYFSTPYSYRRLGSTAAVDGCVLVGRNLDFPRPLSSMIARYPDAAIATWYPP